MALRHPLPVCAALLILCLGGCAAPRVANQVQPQVGLDLALVAEPRRVVSTYPTASEILVALGKAGAVAGITLHDRTLPGLENTPMIGGFAQPDVGRIAALQPDLIIAAAMHERLLAPLAAQGIPILFLDTTRLADAPANIRRIGQVMGAAQQAEAVIQRETHLQELAAAKVSRLSGAVLPRVMRVMAVFDDALLAPGDDSFQNELIRHAGGLPPSFGMNGQAVRVRPEQVRAFAPDIVYVGALDPAWVMDRLRAPKWGASRAKVLAFPRDLVSRAAANYGFFSLWLAAELHGAAFAGKENQVRNDAALSRRKLTLPFSHVAEAAVSEATIFDFPAKTLTIRFTSAQRVLSSLDGWRTGITVVGNHYGSPPSWPVTHHMGLEASNARILQAYGLDAKTTAFLYTGADMDNLAYAQTESDGMIVGVFATAGVTGNAMRASVDAGRYVEAGTINVILLTNRRLTPAAMTRAIITVTEAKTAALEDLDIRGSYSGRAATGTGTDNVLVVAGNGPGAGMTGGHTKLGELIARATYQAVAEAIARHHAMTASRDIFQRLRERKIVLPPAPHMLAPDAGISPQELALGLERLLLDPRHAGFMEAALAIADSEERGLISDLRSFSAWSLAVASEVAGETIHSLREVFVDATMPPVARAALNALATGLWPKSRKL